MTQIALTGNEAVALAMKQINPDVVAAYPITPQTEIVQIFSQFVADGEVDTEFITVESEHSAMSANVGAASSGARAMTATSANGLALMWEILYIASSNRLPIIMPVVNRALSGPINIHCDHSDAMGARDTGWIQIFGENVQEAYDNTFQAVRIAEAEGVMLPVMVNMDGFIISHAVENILRVDDASIKDFIGEYIPQYSLLNVDEPITSGPVALQDFYMEHKRKQVEAMKMAYQIIPEIGKAYGQLTGRYYDFFTSYRIEDAEIILLGLGSTTGTAQAAIDNLRREGVKVGLIKLRVFRPFPAQELVTALSNCKTIGVLDRSATYSLNGGALYNEICTALFAAGQIKPVKNFVYGLGGRDTTVTDIENMIRELMEINETGNMEEITTYYGVRE